MAFLLLVGLLLWPLAATAQDTAPAPDAPENPEIALPDVAPPPDVEAIEITGERLDSTNVQDEAQAITAFDQTDLDRAGILSVDNLGQNVPSLHVGQQGNQAIITLRGIGTQNASIAGEPGVQFHVDGVNYARPSAARVAFFDLESVQVHRGPYGTRGGKNASGGAIEVSTRKPTDEFSVEGDYQIGSYDQRRARGAINIPLLPEAARARFAFITEDRDGYQEVLNSPSRPDLPRFTESDYADDADRLGLRGHLSLVPHETLEVLLSYNYYQAKGVGPGLKLVLDRHFVQCEANQATLMQYGQYVTTQNLSRSSAQRLGVPDGPYYLFRRGTFVAPPGVTMGARFNQGQNEWVQLFYPREGFTRLSDKAYCVDVHKPDQIKLRPSEDPADPRQVYLDRIQQQDNKIWGYAATFNWDVPELPLLGATQLTSISGFEHTSLADPRDFDTTDVPILVIDPTDNTSYQYSSELRLASAGDEQLEWLGGVFYQREHSEVFLIGTLFNADEGFRIDQYNIVTSYGAFADFKLHLSDAVTLGLGGRYSYDSKRTKLERNNGFGFRSSGGGEDEARKVCIPPNEWEERAGQLGGDPGAIPAPVCTRRSDWWTGEAVLEWRPADSHLLYAQLDTGYKAGGFIVGDSGRFDPERNLAYTIGAKSQFFDSRLQLNLEAFHYDYTDFQVVNIDGTSIRTENAPDVRVRGVELEAKAEPVDGLRLDAKIGWLDASFREFCSVDPLDPNRAVPYSNGRIPCAGSDFDNDEVVDPEDVGTHPGDILDGMSLPRSPKLTYTLAAEYAIPLSRWGSLIPRIQYNWADEAYYRVYNTAVDFQDNHHQTDLRLIWLSPEETWTFEAFVENVENDDIYQNMVLGSNVVGPPPLAQYAPPRIYGFRVGFKY
jgi:iron complex outermembrane receptor protein